MGEFNFDNIDWELFREQKLSLIIRNDELSAGILHMMDDIQDTAFATGRFTEEQIYGPKIEG